MSSPVTLNEATRTELQTLHTAITSAQRDFGLALSFALSAVGADVKDPKTRYDIATGVISTATPETPAPTETSDNVEVATEVTAPPEVEVVRPSED